MAPDTASTYRTLQRQFMEAWSTTHVIKKRHMPAKASVTSVQAWLEMHGSRDWSVENAGPVTVPLTVTATLPWMVL